MIVETESAGRVGLIGDELLGQQQVVIKNLDSNYRAVPGISATNWNTVR